MTASGIAGDQFLGHPLNHLNHPVSYVGVLAVASCRPVALPHHRGADAQVDISVRMFFSQLEA